MSSQNAEIAVIGGSGLYEMDALNNVEQVDVDTPFGSPSDRIVLGELGGVRVAFLPRHGRGHRFNPTHIPVRANIYALKSLGVERILSVSAVGSLKEELRPLDLVIPDQIIDRTKTRISTFFGDGLVAHVGFADPFCPDLRRDSLDAADGLATVHDGGTYVVIEGPQFSTRAESALYRSWDADVIGMTALPEAKLAREAEICYATLAFVTDYDVWRESEEDVSVEMVVANLMKNVETARTIIRNIAARVSSERECGCGTTLETAIITGRDLIPHETRERLGLLVDRYLN
ncbi:MAG: S-methyl-5'-thioadenosine phosphorylase [Dehalococcoidia bacterium]|nr:S-methyl-5'-thioadenosine phosphorylase [Dehalococcoidia bacterium]